MAGFLAESLRLCPYERLRDKRRKMFAWFVSRSRNLSCLITALLESQMDQAISPRRSPTSPTSNLRKSTQTNRIQTSAQTFQKNNSMNLWCRWFLTETLLKAAYKTKKEIGLKIIRDSPSKWSTPGKKKLSKLKKLMKQELSPPQILSRLYLSWSFRHWVQNVPRWMWMERLSFRTSYNRSTARITKLDRKRWQIPSTSFPTKIPRKIKKLSVRWTQFLLWWDIKKVSIAWTLYLQQ